MKLFFHFAVVGFSNTYLIGPDEPGDAILVDPGILDTTLLRMIESHGYYIRSILVTHAHEAHIHGIKTLLKVYDAQIYASAYRIMDYPCNTICGGDKLSLSGIQVDVIDLPGHSNDSVVYRIGNMIFTGDALSAGDVGTTPNAYARALLIQNIREKVFPLGDNLVLLPGHGPPSTLRAERLTNPALKEKL